MDSLTLSDWIVCALCVIFLGIAKAGFAGGIGVLATPLMALVMPASQAVGILLPVLLVCDAFCLYAYWGVYCRRNLFTLLPGTAVGILLAAGTILVFRAWRVDVDRALEIAIGIVSILFVLYQGVRAWTPGPIERFQPAHWHGWLLGGAAGLTSTLAHAGGPPVAMYLLPQKLDRGLFVGTTVWLFAAINLLKLGPYWALGLLPLEGLENSLALLPLVPVGVLLGVWMNRSMGDRCFTGIVYILLVITGFHLLFDWSALTAWFSSPE